MKMFCILILTFLTTPLLANAAVELAVNPSATEITEDENLSVEFKVTADGVTADIGDVKFEAPDFDEINSFARTNGIESRFINGQITVRHTQSIVSVLHARHTGKLVIRNIQVPVSGKIVRAQDLTIDVQKSGSALANKGSSGSGYPQQGQLPSGGVHAPKQQTGMMFLRTEPDKLKAYKGEQIMLTYSAYTRTNIMNIQVERYPNINGFLKEDVDIPLLRGRLDYTPAVVNGREYRRAVLAQYAIYPLKEGMLPIDTFTGKFAYQTGARSGVGDEDDPFQMLNNFFRSMQTVTETRSSDRISIDVQPLPAAGQPQSFSGLVGDFSITAVADKYTAKVGEPINVKVKVEGKGHAGSLEHLNVKWPTDFELYEDKSSTQFIKTGHTERLFEYMLIPKTKGKFEIPTIELSMFNPDLATYQIRKSQPINIEVLEGSLGNVYVAKTKPGSPNAVQGTTEDIRYWIASVPEKNSHVLKAVARGVAMASMVLVVLSMWSLGGSNDEVLRQAKLKSNQALRERAKALPKSQVDAHEMLGEVESILGQALEAHFGIMIGSLTRAEVREAVQQRMDETKAKRIEALLELCENQRYAPGTGDRAAAQRAAAELYQVVDQIYLT